MARGGVGGWHAGPEKPKEGRVMRGQCARGSMARGQVAQDRARAGRAGEEEERRGDQGKTLTLGL